MTMSVKLPMMNADRATDRNMKNVAQIVSAMFWAAAQKVWLSAWRTLQESMWIGPESQQNAFQSIGKRRITPVKSP